MFSKIEMIPLETSPNCLIKSIDKKVFFRGRYYLMDRYELSVLVFDEKGKFCFKIKNVGEGPGEYTMLHDFGINR
ncbi:MAG TPA: 6-bladed beta-propeller, partial [Bacteroidales bacterium]|nr:6-bladed beta-propeller [Bacteroidales bacterium]